jgi:hypothetical protein
MTNEVEVSSAEPPALKVFFKCLRVTKLYTISEAL